MRTSITTVSLIALAAVLGACGLGRGTGSQPAVTTLTFANVLDDHEQLEPFAASLEKLSGGSLALAFEDGVHQREGDDESLIIDDVQTGRFDLAWVAQRPWPARGIHSFDALVAPFTVDDYELQDQVLGDPVVEKMLAGLDGSGLVGVGILPGPLRYVATRERPFLTPDAVAGATVAIDDTSVADDLLTTLGATPRRIGLGVPIGDADAGISQLGAIFGNEWDRSLRQISDVAVWPRPIIVIANKPRFDALSPEQQRHLRQAIADARAATIDLHASGEAATVAELCRGGTTISRATAEQRAALVTAAAPVLADLRSYPLTSDVLDRIATLKSNLGAPAGLGGCTAAAEPSPDAPAVGFPDGVYQADFSCEELQAYWTAHDIPDDNRFGCPMLQGFTLANGTFTEIYGARWTFDFVDDKIQLGSFTMRWRYDPDSGLLTFSDVTGDAEPGDVLVWTAKPYQRVDEPAVGGVGIPDGTYTADVDVEDLQGLWNAFGIPPAEREACPCRYTFTLRDDVWTGDDGSLWEPSFLGDRLTLTDRHGSITLRWRLDPASGAVSFVDVEAPEADRAALMTFFTAAPWTPAD